MTLPQCDMLRLEAEGPKLTLWLNRPDSRNAINAQMSDELNALVEALESHETIRLVVLRGAGGHFCAGGDIKERGAMDPDSVRARNERAGHMFRRFQTLPQTTIAVVEGSAFGGGVGFACVADITIMSETARLGLPETRLGIAPAQIAPFVADRVGESRTRQLALTGARFTGSQAHDYGISHYLAGEDELEQVLEEVTNEVLACAPHASAATKKIISETRRLPPEERPAFAAKIFAELSGSGEGAEGAAAFREKRKPDWSRT